MIISEGIIPEQNEDEIMDYTEQRISFSLAENFLGKSLSPV